MAEHVCRYRTLVVLWVAAALTLSGCAANKPKPEGPSAETNPAAAAGAGGSTSASVAGSVDQEASGPMSGLLAVRVVYFDFDSAEIKAAGTDVVAAHAKYLAANPTARVRLEGHTDERGSREYNIGLGERRAQAVRRALLLQGAADGQISTVSYGEERPAVPGHNEAAWAKNRRTEIVYLTPVAPPKP